MEKEKKLNTKQKIALERIYRLFELAQKADDTYQKRYLQLAKRIGEKVNVSIPKEMQKTYCKKCFSMKIKIKNEDTFSIIECECGFKRKIRKAKD